MYAHLIDPVIKVLRGILDLTATFEQTHKERTLLISLLRKLMAMRELHTYWFVSVTGTQGAGKTRLMQELYGLEGWLVDNAGRGERRPLFIVEKDCTVPFAVGVKQDGTEVPIDRETLIKELRSFADKDQYLMLRLYVPVRYAQEGFGFLLLPGYERLNSSNQDWQKEMREVLRHSIGSILVTDQTRLANEATVKILNDLMMGCLSNRSPIVAISRTEGLSAEDREQLRDSAAAVCHVDSSEKERIVCTGVGNEYREQWLPLLKTAMERYTKGSLEARVERVDDLAIVVDTELEQAVTLLDGLIGSECTQATGQQFLLDDMMKKFRDSAEKYRRELERKLRAHSQSYARLATEKARSSYENEEEGFINKTGNFFKKLSWQNSDIEKRFRERIISAWQSPDAKLSPLDITYRALSEQANKKLKFHYEETKNLANGSIINLVKTGGIPKLLGYEERGKAIQPFGSEVDLVQLQNCLRLLLQENNSTIDTLDRIRAQSGEFDKALELLPALSMEFMRLAQASQLVIEGGTVPDRTKVAVEPKKIMEHINDELSSLTGGTKDIVKTVMAISVVDMGIDGSFDVGTILAGGEVVGLGATLSVAAAGLISLGYIGIQLSNEVYQHDVTQKNIISSCLDNLASDHVEKVLQTYDEIIETVSERLAKNLSRAYGIDPEKFSERDALARALYSLRNVRRDLATELSREKTRFMV